MFDITDVVPDYEDVYVSQLRRVLTAGDRVIVVGGGHGVSTVVAANRVAPDGHVTVYEGNEEWCEVVRETVDINEVTDTVTVREAVVGEAIATRGETQTATVVAPSDLPGHDVLALDCEGAERFIIGETDADTIVVETHGIYGSPPDEIRDLLRTHGYRIEREDEDWPDDGINVITAQR